MTFRAPLCIYTTLKFLALLGAPYIYDISRLRVNDLYSSPNIVRVIKSRRMRWVGHVACMGERRDIYRVFAGRPEGKRPFGRPRHRWEDNIKMDLQEVGCWEYGFD